MFTVHEHNKPVANDGKHKTLSYAIAKIQGNEQMITAVFHDLEKLKYNQKLLEIFMRNAGLEDTELARFTFEADHKTKSITFKDDLKQALRVLKELELLSTQTVEAVKNYLDGKPTNQRGKLAWLIKPFTSLTTASSSENGEKLPLLSSVKSVGK